MASVAATQFGGVKVSLVKNTQHWDGGDYKPKSFGSIVLGYLDTANGGPFRSLQIGGKFCSLLSLIVGNGQIFKDAEKIFTGGWSATIIPRVPGAFVEAKNAVAAVFHSTSSLPGAFTRKCINAVQESATFIGAVGYATAPFLKLAEKTSQASNSIFRGAQMATFVGDSCEMVKSFGDTLKTRAMILMAKATDGVSSELTSMLADSEKLYMMKTMKAVCSVASFVLGLAFAATGLGVLPSCAIMAASISLASSLLGAAANLHGDSMKYKSIQFYDDKHVQLVDKEVVVSTTLPDAEIAQPEAVKPQEKPFVDPYGEDGHTVFSRMKAAKEALMSRLMGIGNNG